MIEKIKKYREGILYLIFGGLATLVNYAIFFPLTAILPENLAIFGIKIAASLATTVAWVGAVTFAFITNKLWVFKSKTKGQALAKEAGMFVAARIASLIMEVIIVWAFIDTWKLIGGTLNVFGSNFLVNDLVIKTIAQIAVIVANYFLSKLIIFKKKDA